MFMCFPSVIEWLFSCNDIHFISASAERRMTLTVARPTKKSTPRLKCRDVDVVVRLPL
jgi:hypothetical protein